MVDEIYDRGYQAGRAELHDGIDALVRKLRDAIAPALSTLYHFEWDAPWNVKPGAKPPPDQTNRAARPPPRVPCPTGPLQLPGAGRSNCAATAPAL